jgi:hypothetical protein
MQSNDPDNDYAYDRTNQSASPQYLYTLSCACGWRFQTGSQSQAAVSRVAHRAKHSPARVVITETRSPR